MKRNKLLSAALKWFGFFKNKFGDNWFYIKRFNSKNNINLDYNHLHIRRVKV